MDGVPLDVTGGVFEAEGLDADGGRAREDLAAALGALDARAARFVERRAQAEAARP